MLTYEKIMLSCGAGMSSSLLAKKIQKEADCKNLDVEVHTVPRLNQSSMADVVPLGPQISYMKKDIEQSVSDHMPVVVIGMLDYGRRMRNLF